MPKKLPQNYDLDKCRQPAASAGGLLIKLLYILEHVLPFLTPSSRLKGERVKSTAAETSGSGSP